MNPDHKSHTELSEELTAAKTQITIGGKYKHYKYPSKVYQVKALGVLEQDNNLCVIYQGQYGGRLTFVRPVVEWLEQVEWNGKSVPRFTKVN